MKVKIEDYIGKRFANLVVVGIDSSKEHFNANHWIFRCDCGKEFSDCPSRILSGHKKSCGCQKWKSSLTHGLNGDEFFHTWWGMMRRCYNKEAHNYERYGGRGITVCQEWHDPETFIQWARETIGHKASGLTLDRIENSKGYSPQNCKWSTPKEQSRNRDVTTFGSINGITKSLAEWCEIYGIGLETARQRIKAGMTFEAAVTTPIHSIKTGFKKGHKSNSVPPFKIHIVEIDGEKKSITEWCEIFGTDRNLSYQRIQRGWEPEKAIKTPKNTDRGSWRRKKAAP